MAKVDFRVMDKSQGDQSDKHLFFGVCVVESHILLDIVGPVLIFMHTLACAGIIRKM